MKQFHIRRVNINDLASLQKIGRLTFLETFSTGNSDTNMARYLEESFATEKLTAEINHPESEFYFALFEDQIVGYLKINTGTAQTELQEKGAFEIERIYVAKAFHGKNAGQILFEKAEEIAIAKRSVYIWLGVWQGNERAIRFYQKQGFAAFGQHVFQLGADDQIDILMKKELFLSPQFDLQPLLKRERIILQPLTENDFEDLYSVASDPRIWEQHPNKDRWQREVFQNFFTGALLSKGAFKIIDQTTGYTVGSTRFYDYDALDHSVLIGYTFYAVSQWGTGLNIEVKREMLDYAFQYVSKVYFHIGALNIRSQIAISRLGAIKIDEQEIPYFGEAPKLNFIYQIDKESWKKHLLNKL